MVKSNYGFVTQELCGDFGIVDLVEDRVEFPNYVVTHCLLSGLGRSAEWWSSPQFRQVILSLNSAD